MNDPIGILIFGSVLFLVLAIGAIVGALVLIFRDWWK